MTTQSSLIQLHEVSKKFGKLIALNQVSLSIKQGEFLALLGPSGCGKTTLLRTIAGFSEPTFGDISIEGKSVRRDPPNRRPVNTVFQDYALFPHMTVADNVAFGPRRQGMSKSILHTRVIEALSLVDMENFSGRYPSELSGGQQQRVALARAIINQPKVLLLDEPLAALDLKLRKRMQIELKRLHERLGITFIVVTHDQEEALVMADRIVVMSSGRIEQCGVGDHIYAEPQTRFVADFIGEANLIDCSLDKQGYLQTQAHQISLPYRVDSKIGSNATLMIRPEHIHIVDDAEQRAGCVVSSGIVRDVVYAGAITRIYISDSSLGHEIVVCRPDGVSWARPEVGQNVYFSWCLDKGKVLFS